MSLYEVTMYGTWSKTYHITAASEDEARQIWDDFTGEDERVELAYDHDLGEDGQEWEGKIMADEETRA